MVEDSGGSELFRIHATDSTSLFQGFEAGDADDGTNNGNTGFGRYTLTSVTSGASNVAFGNEALLSNITGSQNTAIGTYSLNYNTASDNTAIGHSAFLNNTTGGGVAVGAHALSANTTGGANTAIGFLALTANTTAQRNTAVGTQALYVNTTGDENTSVGFQSLFALLPTSGAITVFADGGGGQVVVTSASHGQSNGTSVLIEGTTNYNGSFTISAVDTNTFEITDTWVSDDATGWWGIA
ncbi:unnamed protein product, partial [marine sediment metagenome]